MLRRPTIPRQPHERLRPRAAARIFNADTNLGGTVRVKIQKWGNGLALRLPKRFAELLGVEDGCEVELLYQDAMLLVKLPRNQPYTLEEFVSRITDENRHGEIDTGPSVGNEAW